jgi:hypothetical protein
MGGKSGWSDFTIFVATSAVRMSDHTSQSYCSASASRRDSGEAANSAGKPRLSTKARASAVFQREGGIETFIPEAAAERRKHGRAKQGQNDATRFCSSQLCHLSTAGRRPSGTKQNGCSPTPTPISGKATAGQTQPPQRNRQSAATRMESRATHRTPVRRESPAHTRSGRS